LLSGDPRGECGPYITEKNGAKMQRIGNWRNEINQTLQTRKEVTYEDLERELRGVITEREKKK
jgi:hypothetical protein